MSVKLLSPLVPPNMTTAQRDAIPAGKRPPGSMLFNTTTNRIEVNYGTDATPSWSPLTPWALIGYVQLAAPAVPISFASIPQTYKHLLAVGFMRGSGTGNVMSFGARFNGDSSNAYGWSGVYVNPGGSPIYPNTGAYASQRIGYGLGGASDQQFCTFVHFIPSYTRAERRSSIAIGGGFHGASEFWCLHGGRYYGSANPLTQLDYFVETYGSLNLDTGSTVSLYGLG